MKRVRTRVIALLSLAAASASSSSLSAQRSSWEEWLRTVADSDTIHNLNTWVKGYVVDCTAAFPDSVLLSTSASASAAQLVVAGRLHWVPDQAGDYRVRVVHAYCDGNTLGKILFEGNGVHILHATPIDMFDRIPLVLVPDKSGKPGGVLWRAGRIEHEAEVKARELEKNRREASRLESERRARIQRLRSEYRQRGWSDADITKIFDRQVWIGMTRDQLIASWGKPEQINSTITAAGRSEQMVYGYDYVYVTNGKVRAIQTSR